MADDPAVFCLHKEGIFYKLYNQHAMLFTDNIKELKIKAKFVKAVNQQVYSCGFPASILEGIKKQLVDGGGVITEAEKMLQVTGIAWKNIKDYPQWCNEQQKEEAAATNNSSKKPLDLAKEITGFQVMQTSLNVD